MPRVFQCAKSLKKMQSISPFMAVRAKWEEKHFFRGKLKSLFSEFKGLCPLQSSRVYQCAKNLKKILSGGLLEKSISPFMAVRAKWEEKHFFFEFFVKFIAVIIPLYENVIHGGSNEIIWFNESNYFPLKKGFSLYKSVIKHPVYLVWYL